MANRSALLSSFFRCTGLSASTSIFPTAACLRFRSVSQLRPVLIPLLCWAIPRLAALISVPRLRVLGFTRPRARYEAVTNLHCTQPAHVVADDFCSVYCDRTRRGPLFLGLDSLRGRWIQR